MRKKRSRLFRGRHFEAQIIILCVRWYLRYSLSYRDLQELISERSLSVDHTTVWRWVQRYGPVLSQRIRRELRRPNRSWRVDETYVRVAGNWVYLYRAVDSTGETIDFMLRATNQVLHPRMRQHIHLASGQGFQRILTNWSILTQNFA